MSKKKQLRVNIDSQYWEKNFEERSLNVTNNYKKRNLHGLEFDDSSGKKCSLQASSLATEGAIWFGVDNTGPVIKGNNGKYNEDIKGGRMHLTRKQVEDLLPYLHRFVETGVMSFDEED